MLASAPKPLLIAHRGASKYAPENTIAAFELALEYGAKAIEFDVSLSADGEVVIIHDNRLERTSNGAGWVHQQSLSDLKKLDIGRWFNPKFSGEKIPTLDQVFALFDKKIILNIEIKKNLHPKENLCQKIAELIKKYDLEKYVIVSSFHLKQLKEISKLLPNINIGVLSLPAPLGWYTQQFSRRWINHSSFHPHQSSVSQNMINNLHKEGKRVYTYTVNQPELMRRLISWNVDGFFTDDLILANQIAMEFNS